jgi:rRNA maturation endonuclease Nob1
MITLGELERIWKEVAVACFKVLFCPLCGGTEATLENPLNRDSRYQGRDSS